MRSVAVKTRSISMRQRADGLNMTLIIPLQAVLCTTTLLNGIAENTVSCASYHAKQHAIGWLRRFKHNLVQRGTQTSESMVCAILDTGALLSLTHKTTFNQTQARNRLLFVCDTLPCKGLCVPPTLDFADFPHISHAHTQVFLFVSTIRKCAFFLYTLFSIKVCVCV